MEDQNKITIPQDNQRKVNAENLAKYRKKVMADFNVVKHKSVLRKIVGSNAVSLYFNNGISSFRVENLINIYFNNLKK